MNTKNLGYKVAGSAEFLVHQRFGKILRQGREIGFFCLPFIDACYRIPSSTHGLNFTADQITAENQGVEVSGFAIWKICDPGRICRNFDFSDPGAAIKMISGSLKDVVESAIRHQVANMSIEEVLRKRGSIILKLKQELAYIAEQWGLIIETIEIKNVRIMSKQLFENMQAKFRDSVRLESETSELETDRAVAERRFTQREQLALREQEFKRMEMERKAEIDSLAICAEAKLEATKAREEKELRIRRLSLAMEVKKTEHANRWQEIQMEEKIHACQREAQKELFLLEVERTVHEGEKAALRDGTERARIETANTADPVLAAIEKLPRALAGIKLNTMNIGYDTLVRIADGLAGLATNKKP